MLCSLAYQLAVALPAFRATLREQPGMADLDPAATDLATLFDLCVCTTFWQHL